LPEEVAIVIDFEITSKHCGILSAI